MKLNQDAAASIIFTEGGVYYEQRRNQLQKPGSIYPDGHCDLLPAEDARDVAGTVSRKSKHQPLPPERDRSTEYGPCVLHGSVL